MYVIYAYKQHHLYSLCPAIYLFKVNNRNTSKNCEICSKLTIQTPEQRQRGRSGVFIVNFEHISQLFLAFLLLTLRNYSFNGRYLAAYNFQCLTPSSCIMNASMSS